MNKTEFVKQQESLLRQLQKWCGAIPVGGPLNIIEKERREYRTHTEIKLSYDGDPGERIPAYLLIPRGIGTERRPAIFAAHQCAWACDIGKEQVAGKSVDWPDQAYGLELVREGFVVLAPDANKVGERFDPALREQWQTAADLGNSQHACCTSGGGSWGNQSSHWKRVYDVMRGIDVLCQNEHVNPERIGMIGHSLGAATTLWTMPQEKRIIAGVISGGSLMGLGAWPHGLPYSDILQLIAPRPFFEAVGNEDYPNICEAAKKSLPTEERMTAKHDVHKQAKEFYKLYDQADGLELFVFNGGHQFPEAARKASYAFLKRHLMPR